ncbi:hypothetical protein [Trinickia acidisoli]|uniref:hypothetical protein n=1 Tax=Trinickia acidisoli TaxID=2767482 RepID=UPI001A906014|nr:hypothetical protein [Trinickia acidisoli]
MERTVHDVTGRMPPPSLVQQRGYRYAEKDAYRAIIQKMARIVSALRAARLLLAHGFIQEQAAICRIVGEAEVDVTFLALGIVYGETELHKRFLTDFYQEEHDDPERPMHTRIKRGNIPRDRIIAFIVNTPISGDDPSTAIAAMQTVHKATSGYIHGASPFLMEMYEGHPALFHMNGLRDSPLWQDHRDDIWNYIYRALTAFCIAAKAFGDQKLFDMIWAYTQRFASSEPN